MSRSLVLGPFGALALITCLAGQACACSCLSNDFYAAFAGSHAVFVGEVLEISRPGPEHIALVTVTVRVESAWKGASAPSTTQVVTASSDASCGFPFRVGARYLIYADGSLESGELLATLCSRTHEMSPDDPDLALLESPLPAMHLTVSPNPSVSSFRLAWTVLGDPGQHAIARVEILDFQGRRIRTLMDGPAAAGPHHSFWDGNDEHGQPTRAGVYWLRVAYGDRVLGRQLIRMPPHR